jgi:hypothetical protein
MATTGMEDTMAVVVQLDCPGFTLDQYDRFMESRGFLPGGPLPSGALFHVVVQTATGIRITDVWESAEIYQKVTAEKGIGSPQGCEIQVFEVHNYLTAGHR